MKLDDYEFLEKDLDDSAIYSKFEVWNKHIKEIKQLAFLLEEISWSSNSFPLGFDGVMNTSSFSNLLTSSNKTLLSIATVLKLGNIADAFMLIRKYRDNLFFFLDMYVSGRKNIYEEGRYEKYGKEWSRNVLRRDYTFGKSFQEIINSEKYKSFNIKFDIEKRFKDINTLLNRNTHSSGICYLNLRYETYHFIYKENTQDEFIGKKGKRIVDMIYFICIVFYAMISIDSPWAIASNDYVDCLDLGLKPPVNSQYYVSPVFKDLFEIGNEIIGKGFVDFIATSTGMDFT